MSAELGMIAVLITTCASAIVAVISQIQHSRCEKIKMCCGIFECSRKVPDVQEPTVELHPDGIQPDGIQPDGIQPDGIKPNGIQNEIIHHK
tara:strand:- start:202 stop:474 length:273 start_codon:yes stop_codon:yes gene_type:complete